MGAEAVVPGKPAERGAGAAVAPPSLERHLPAIEALLHEVIRHGRFNLTFTIHRFESPEKDIEDPEFVVDFSGLDADLLLEAHGELLNALEYVVLKAARLEESFFNKITFDCLGWRTLRIEELKLMAQVAADRVMETGAPLALGAMNARERRVVHLALKDREKVHTESQGFGPERKVVILPASTGARPRRA